MKRMPKKNWLKKILILLWEISWGVRASGFGVDTNTVTLFYRDGTKEAIPEMQKHDVAHILLDRIVRRT